LTHFNIVFQTQRDVLYKNFSKHPCLLQVEKHITGYVRDSCTGVCWENLRERDHWIDLDVDGRIILKQTFRKWDVGTWTRLSWLRIETGVGHFEML
jgi:hypothetical protein